MKCLAQNFMNECIKPKILILVPMLLQIASLMMSVGV
jgi:hypothetical protein